MGDRLNPEYYDIYVAEPGNFTGGSENPKENADIDERHYRPLVRRIRDEYGDYNEIRDMGHLEGNQYVVSFGSYTGGTACRQSEFLAIVEWDSENLHWEILEAENIFSTSFH